MFKKLGLLLLGIGAGFGAYGIAYKGSSVNTRKPGYPINQLIIDRWSPRAMSGEPITDEQLMTLFEAARWAPSSYND